MSEFELHTDALKRVYNDAEITCQVLCHSLAFRHRLSILNVKQQEKTTPVALAVTWLTTDTWPQTFQAVDAELQNGALMGETFRSHGFRIRQNQLFSGKLAVKNSQVGALFQTNIGTKMPIECYEFWANSHQYGVVLEIKSPQNTIDIARKRLGSHRILEQLGVAPENFTAWLYDKQAYTWKDKYKITASRVHGTVASMARYHKAQQFISEYLPR